MLRAVTPTSTKCTRNCDPIGRILHMQSHCLQAGLGPFTAVVDVLIPSEQQILYRYVQSTVAEHMIDAGQLACDQPRLKLTVQARSGGRAQHELCAMVFIVPGLHVPVFKL